MENTSKVIESPCIGRCCLEESNICLGCYRSITEIKSWAQADNQTRRAYLDNAQHRRKLKSAAK